MHIRDLLALSIEEQAALQNFEKELDRLMASTPPVIPETEISKIESTLTNIIEEIVDRGRKQANKSNA
jgi:hypothetical protein